MCQETVIQLHLGEISTDHLTTEECINPFGHIGLHRCSMHGVKLYGTQLSATSMLSQTNLSANGKIRKEVLF